MLPTASYFLFAHHWLHGFSDIALRAIITNFLRANLGFTSASYFNYAVRVFSFILTPFGAALGDSVTNKYNIVSFAAIFHCLSKCMLLFSSFPYFNKTVRIVSVVAYGMFKALADAATRSNVSALQGDQFKLPEEWWQFRRYFYIRYIIFNIIVILGFIATPHLAKEIPCMGEQTCYAIGFGLATIAEFVATIIFISGKRFYIIRTPERKMMENVFNCIRYAFTHWLHERTTNPRQHWLDHAEPKYGKQLVNDIKRFLRLIQLYLMCSLFYMAFYHLDSKWIIQAANTNGDVLDYTIIPDYFDLLNPIFVIFIASITALIDPYLKYIKLERVLRWVITGGVLVGLSFYCAGILEYNIEKAAPYLPKKHEAQLHIYNGLDCDAIFYASKFIQDTIEIPSLGGYTKNRVQVSGEQTFDLSGIATCASISLKDVIIQEEQAVTYYIFSKDGVANIAIYKNWINQETGLPVIFIVGAKENDSIAIEDAKKALEPLEHVNDNCNICPWAAEVLPQTYTIYWNNEKIGRFKTRLGGEYAVMLTNTSMRYFEVTQPNSVHMAWMLPQSFIFALGETYFSVGLYYFTYSEAPMSLKSLVSALDCCSRYFGEVMVILTTLDFHCSLYIVYYIFASVVVACMLALIFLARGLESLYPSVKLI